jgi:hypothetical protein
MDRTLHVSLFCACRLTISFLVFVYEVFPDIESESLMDTEADTETRAAPTPPGMRVPIFVVRVILYHGESAYENAPAAGTAWHRFVILLRCYLSRGTFIFGVS